MKKKSVLLLIFRIVSAIIIIVCLIKIFMWFKENKKNKQLQDKLLSKINTDIDSERSQDTKLDNINFEELFEINPNTVGWIKVPGTDINYCVAKANDNEFYLTHSFDNSYNSAGWIFADYRNNFNGADKNIIIYGHNRHNGSMFSTLKNILNEDWYTNEENYIITFYTPDGVKKYKVFSVYQVPVSELNLPVSFDNNKDFTSYLDEIKNKSIYDFNESVGKSDSIITLYTCTDNNLGRILLHAKLIK